MFKYKINLLFFLTPIFLFAESFEYRAELKQFWDLKCKINDEKNCHPDMKQINNILNNAIYSNELKESWYKNLIAIYYLIDGKATEMKPDDMPKLHIFIKKICDKHAMKMPTLLINNNKSVINAEAGKLLFDNGIINISPGLINNLNDSEIEAILVHELGHLYYNHSIFLSLYYLIDKFLITKLAIEILKDSKKLLGNSKCFNFTKKFLPNLSTHLIIKKMLIGTYFEQQADKFAMENGYSKELASSMKIFFKDESFRSALENIENARDKISTPEYLALNLVYYYKKLLNYKYNNFWSSHPIPEDRAKRAEEFYKNLNQID